MLTHVLIATQLFLGATSVYTPSDNPVAKLKTEPANLVSQLKAKAAKGDGEAAFKLYKIYLEDQNEPEWRAWLQKSADLNNAEGQYFSGLLLYENESATEEDKQKAIKYYFSAAQKGNADAQATIGDGYYLGTIGEEDHKQAAVWYQLAADQNHPFGTNNLAIFYAKGLGGLKADPEKALKLHSRAAYLGSNYAQTAMGSYYIKGDLVEENKSEGFAWTWLAVENQSEYAERKIELLVQDLTPEEYFKGRKRITEIKKLIDQNKIDQPIVFKKIDVVATAKRSKEEIEEFKLNLAKAEKGDAEAQYRVGRSYDYGEGLEISKKDAFYWYEKSAKQGYADAQCKLGFIYLVGNSFVRPNSEESVKWFEKGAAQNELFCLDLLGDAYRDGDGVRADEKKSLECYKKAADLGHRSSQVSYADYYFKKNLNHSSTKAEDEICLKYLKMAAKQIDTQAFLKLGLYYITIKEDHVEGLAWLYLADNCFSSRPSRLEYFWNTASPEENEKAEKRGDQIIKELLQKNKK
jgi:TPR repeat protein